MKIETVEKADHLKLLEIWEASVRATHDFLAEEDLQELKPLILEQYFNAVDLRCAKNGHGEIQGFCGVHDGNIEMLFIAPDARGKGVGAMLAANAIDEQGASKVDVNEQNVQALGFYQYIGFKVTGLSPVDGQGKAYPLLHMAL
ncbi:MULTISPECIES: acetyltransferase [Halomonadaceae]|uniref:N-acetyltransferase YjaB n=1 Tax=Vreelandella titanicae TaxID=664683 RepID=A0AAP9T1J9_9GAMM|nr:MULTISPECIES: acetyltransferase [Halomonas]QKS24978.1 putative N-acetyltransferase YjaB [Halomonas titanicae]CDG53890.1 putative acetyltransferase [Halomonas sp. A3H3]SDJ26582.1 putative acetyltransferase [Halomonas titanicae]